MANGQGPLAGEERDTGRHRGTELPTQTTGHAEPETVADEAAEAGEGLAGALQTFLTAFAALDWEPFRHCFADDAVVFFPLVDHPERADGREQIERLFRVVFERART